MPASRSNDHDQVRANKSPDPKAYKPKAKGVSYVGNDFGVAIGNPEKLQDCIRLIQNHKLKKLFKDQSAYFDALAAAGEAEPPSPGNQRQQLLKQVFHRDADTISETILKVLAVEFEVMPFKIDHYGIPISDYHDSVVLMPQVELYFRETKAAADRMGRQPVHSRINFRIKQDIETITEAELKALAAKIKASFVGYKLDRGVVKANYYQKQNDYRLSYFASSEADAKAFFTKVLALQNHTFDDEFFTVAKSGKNFTSRDTKMILGKSTRMPRSRPVANCLFRYATFKCHGLRRDVPLVDVTMNFPDAFETIYS